MPSPPLPPPHTLQYEFFRDRLARVLKCDCSTPEGRAEIQALAGQDAMFPYAYLTTSCDHPPHALWDLLQVWGIGEGVFFLYG